MTQIPKHLQIHTEPIADPQAVVTAKHARFTVLTPRMIRMEHSKTGQFEDHASQAFWYRKQPVPAFTVARTGGVLTIETEYLTVTYDENAGEFAPQALAVELKHFDSVWNFGDTDPTNLKGTGRTLDQADGAIPLEDGLMSRSGWAVIDDSKSLVFNANSWLQPRTGDSLDLYFLGYGNAYQDCLNDYMRVTGKIALLPRWAFGNWWSRYYAYTQEELTHLMLEFREQNVPLTVCIVDMDWHITKTGNSSSGWTGYTWEKNLFPDPQGFIRFLHDNQLRTALNLHPADGVFPHEEQYEEMARRMGIDPESDTPIAFDIANPDFMRHYFELLHHPQEADGVDFWWLDWQQGTQSKMQGLDPLWFLNHLHFYDLGRDGSKRPFVFSRWGGLGNHRYPLGFSGDTIISWESLDFQPYFTANAANVGFGWWSHDIGGHYFGTENPELYARWVQYGAFSPILRLHSTANPFHERRPYAQRDLNAVHAAVDAMRLRHAMIPYLYSMSWRTYQINEILARPMYYDYPNREEAYNVPHQYTFGTELIAAPYTQPMDTTTNLSRQVVWLPDGDWYHFFTGEHYRGSSWHAVYGTLQETPVFAKAGAIVPMARDYGWNDAGNPAAFDIHVFAGANNRFELFEDDGESNAYLDGHYSITTLTQDWTSDQLTLTISAPVGDLSHLPAERAYYVHVYGVRPDVTIESPQVASINYDESREVLTIGLKPIAISEEAVITVSGGTHGLLSHRDRTREKYERMLRIFTLPVVSQYMLLRHYENMVASPEGLAEVSVALSPAQQRTLAETLYSAGAFAARNSVVLWNNRATPNFSYQYAELNPHEWTPTRVMKTQAGALPRFAAITPTRKVWNVTVHYGSLTIISEEKK